MYYRYIFFIKCVHLMFNFLFLNICPCPTNKELFPYFKYKAFKVVLLVVVGGVFMLLDASKVIQRKIINLTMLLKFFLHV